tara:strand:- start:10229 stop:11608 length:1380 start_codon:yes stop_codon:yes gene_type:complete
VKITRFAPSPTGNLHIGGVRTALFNFVFSKQAGGLFLIRIEDTDRERSKKEYEEDIISGLEWLGISADKTPIRQSERSDIYQKAAEKLIDSGNAYWCDCSPEDLEAMREQQIAAGKKPMYDGRSRDLGLERSKNTVLRLATPIDGETTVKDLIRGDITFKNSELDDLILLRSDGTPTYHFCNVVDDYDQGITTVIRGEDHISNTPRQIHIQKALGYSELEYAHLPLVLGEDKKRLSKRHAATSLNAYKEMGFTKETIINALALLGWSTENEIFSMNELIESFNLKNVQKGAAVFDLKRFNWVSSQHLAKLNDDAFIEAIHPFMKDEGIDDVATNYKEILIAMRTSKTNLKEIAYATRPFFFELEEYDEKGVNKFLRGSLETLTFALETLSKISEWNETELDMALINVRDYFNLPIPKVNQPMRIALVGSTISPSLGLTLELFGKEKSLERIKKAIDFIS